jgi:hypothetical protein
MASTAVTAIESGSDDDDDLSTGSSDAPLLCSVAGCGGKGGDNAVASVSVSSRAAA